MTNTQNTAAIAPRDGKRGAAFTMPASVALRNKTPATRENVATSSVPSRTRGHLRGGFGSRVFSKN